MLTALLASIAAEPSFNGFLSQRLTLTYPSPASPTSTKDLPVVDALSEANIAARARVFDEALLLSVDASAFADFAGIYADWDPDVDALAGVDAHDVVTARPFVVFSEAFGSFEPFAHLVLTAGKRRVVWGPGQMATATDVLNPPRDPTDPASQREGTWMVAVDAPFEYFTFTAQFLPKVLRQQAGIPFALFAWPDEPYADLKTDPRDDELHYAAVLRAYALFWDADWNAWIVWSNLYDTNRQNELRGMATFAKTIGALEVHGEALLKIGSGRLYPNDACLPDEDDLVACAMHRIQPLTARDEDDTRLTPDLLVGGRYMFEDESMLSVEYLYNADGLMPDEWHDMVKLLTKLGDAQREGIDLPLLTTSSTGGAPQRFSQRALRRHHVYVSYMKPKIADDWTVSGTWIVAPEDLSSLVAGSVQWSAREWLTLSAFAFAPIPGYARAAHFIGLDVDDTYGEFDVLPFSGRLMFEAKVWF